MTFRSHQRAELRFPPAFLAPLAYMPTSPGDRFVGLALMKGQDPQRATHLLDSGVVFEIKFHGVVKEKRRTIAVVELVRPESSGEERREENRS